MHRLEGILAGRTTRSGRTKPVSTIINHVLNRALTHGYVVESYWRLVPARDARQPEQSTQDVREGPPQKILKRRRSAP
jgi:hypothetical protein